MNDDPILGFAAEVGRRLERCSDAYRSVGALRMLIQEQRDYFEQHVRDLHEAHRQLNNRICVLEQARVWERARERRLREARKTKKARKRSR